MSHPCRKDLSDSLRGIVRCNGATRPLRYAFVSVPDEEALTKSIVRLGNRTGARQRNKLQPVRPCLPNQRRADQLSLICIRIFEQRRRPKTRLPDVRQRREHIEHPVREGRELPGYHGDAHQDHDGTRRYLEKPPDATDRPESGHETIGEHRSEQKRHAEPKRVNREQSHPARNRCRRRANGENGAEDWPDAGRPAEGKGESEDIGRERPTASHRGVKSKLPHEPHRTQQTDQEQAEKNDDHPADDIELVAVA